MKKFLTLAASLLLTGVCSISAMAANVYVTIADANGDLALSQKAVEVSDVDGDGTLTINDALTAAHDANYEGGAAAGYGSGLTDYGLSMNKLWGTENGGSYGYYVNNASAWSLTDPVAEGDYVNAFVYTDLTTWSDKYCFFSVQTADIVAGGAVTLTLSSAGYDADYNPITVPVEGAVITINGEVSPYTTDANGSVTLPFAKAGIQVISATSNNMTLVPPVCTVTVSDTAPQTADNTALFAVLASAALFCVTMVSRKKAYER